MKKYLTYAVTAFIAMIAVSIAAPEKAMVAKETMMAKETAAWQAYKDKKVDDFKTLVDKDLRCVYASGISNMQKELDDMAKWDIKSFTISDYEIFSDEKDVVVSTYKVTIEGSVDGKDMSGTYNDGTVWKEENGKWLAIFHSNVKAEAAK
jgi:hypothetical protein